jgi:hypothetical protein
MIKLPLQILTLLAFVFLAGCATVSASKLGISKADWDQYSPEKQEQLISAYETAQASKKAIRAQPGSGVLSVKIDGGQASLPPYTGLTAYEPLLFTVKQGDCQRNIPVEGVDAKSKKGKLEVCYKDNILYLDPSPYDPALALGSLQFPYMPVWKRGFTYSNMTSTGLLKLTGAQIYLREVVPADDSN